MAIVQFKINSDVIKDTIEEGIEYPIIRASGNPRIKELIGNKIIQYANQYVPLKSGGLRSSAHVVQHARQTFITYGQYGVYGIRRGKEIPTSRYARFQYDADDSTWTRSTRGTHSRWLDYVLSPTAYKYSLLTAYIKNIIATEAKK